MINLVKRFFFKEPVKVRDLPQSFKGETLFDADIDMKLIYNRFLSEADKSFWLDFCSKNQIEFIGDTLRINGKELPLMGEVIEIYLTTLNSLIIWDETPYQNIHLYTLSGKHVWDIDPCSYEKGVKAISLGQPFTIKKGADGKDLLLVYFHPVTFATDFYTGKGTYIHSIEDNTDER